MRIRTLTHIHSIIYNNLYVLYIMCFFFCFFFTIDKRKQNKGPHNGSKEECTQITNLCEQKIKKNALP